MPQAFTKHMCTFHPVSDIAAFWFRPACRHGAAATCVLELAQVRSSVRGRVQVMTGRAGDNVQGVTVADLYVLQDQVRASYAGIRDLKERLDQADKHSAW